ncbi:MAG: phosphopantothenate/pantothenate synthetase [Methanoregulaceae archaeon]|nr:phosphopantothenate/pantothenate synthetase [Methanoregulaceae archaeon]
MIPKEHPRYRSLVVRERLAEFAREGVLSLEGLTAHGRGEAFDYLLGESTSESARLAERTAAAMLLLARKPVISVNGNTAALAADQIAPLQQASGALVEVNLFHRTEERIEKITRLLEANGVSVLSGSRERLLPLPHGRAWCLRDGIFSADLVLVPLEDGDRCAALRQMGKDVVTVDLNPLSRTARNATLTVVDELTRALPEITRSCPEIGKEEALKLVADLDNDYFLRAAMDVMKERLAHALD